jgi:polyhydroxybutyrate depolymerase
VDRNRLRAISGFDQVDDRDARFGTYSAIHMPTAGKRNDSLTLFMLKTSINSGWRRLALFFAVICSYSTPLSAGSFHLKSDVGGHARVAKVFESRSQSDKPVPLVLAFHGYGDNRTDFSRFVDLHKAWPDAIVVYPEGLRLPDRSGKLRKKGWQARKDTLGDRDLTYVDFLLEELQARYQVDSQRIYATGFSNGARLVFLLMGQRSNRFAAFVPVGAVAGAEAMEDWTEPKPVMYIIGKGEIANRVEAAQLTVETISRINLSGKKPVRWADEYVLFHPQAGGADFVFYLHDGGHIWPYSASDQVARFLQQHSLRPAE